LSIKVNDSKDPVAEQDSLLVQVDYANQPIPNNRLPKGLYYSFKDKWVDMITLLTPAIKKIVTANTTVPAWGSITGTLSNQTDLQSALDNKMSSDLTDSHIFVGDATNKATDVEMTGDVTIDNTGATTLANTSVTAGTYGNSTNVPQIVVDSKGRITGASNVGVSISGALGYTPEDVSNKATSLTSPDNTKYPTTLATQTALDLKANISAQRSSAVIAFDTEANYGTIASPLTGNITGDYTGAIIGVVQLLIHNDSVAPTIPASWVKANTSASYTIGVVNFIAITWLSSNIATYTIWKSV
jgi:hypothetical protein